MALERLADRGLGEHDPPAAAMAALGDVLAEAADVVHGPTDLAEKVDWVVEAARRLTGATAAALVQEADGGGWGVHGSPEFARLDELNAELVDRALAGLEVVRRDALPYADSAPGLASYLAVPVSSPAGGRHGALVVGHPDVGRFGPEHEAALLALAAHLGVALDNLATIRRITELQAAQREVVHQLQEAVRPPVPAVPETELGVHYLAADPQAPTGGDLYDWQLLPDGDLHLVVVDVLGKGVAATKDALAVTHVIRLLVLDGCPLDRVVARADALLGAQTPDLVATLVVARYTPATGVLRIAGAGHPPALLVSPGRPARALYAPGMAIGWPGAASHEVVSLTLERSDTVVFYTDGLVEAGKNIIKGLESLQVAATETARYPAAHMARALVERALAGASRRDDTLALVLRRRSPRPADGRHRLGPFQYRFSPTAAAVPLARHFLADWLERQPVDREEGEDLLLVASELCSNAVRAASRRPGAVVLRAWAEADSVVLEVEDDGGGLSAPAEDDGEVPDPEAEEGRGLYLVRALTDQVDVERRDGGTVVRCVKRGILSHVPVEVPAG